MLKNLLQNDLATFKFSSVAEFESIVDTLIIQVSETLEALIKVKSLAITKCEKSMRFLYIDTIL